MSDAAVDEDVRAMLLSWNRACASGDVDALAALSAPDVVIGFEGREYRGTDGLRQFARSLAGDGVSVRVHTTHMLAQASGDSVAVRAFAMIVQRAGVVSHGDGSPWPTWLGWTEDTVMSTGDGPVVARREFHAWTDEAVSGFRIEKAELV